MKATLYKTPTCPYCSKALDLLRLRGAEVDVVDVTSSPEKMVEMISKSRGMKVPVIEINGEVIVGFDRLEEKYGFQ